jgi:hypothetical protein
MDFITNLPSLKSFNAIFVILNRLAKMAHFVPYKKIITGGEIARLFMDNVYRYHGLHDDIISNRGRQFVSKFWRSLLEILEVDIKLSSTFHLQTEGQTERVNQVLEQYLKCTINYQQDDWTSYLPLTEFSYNNTIHASTQQTPFYANYGHHLKLDLLDFSKIDNLAIKDFATQLLLLQDAMKLQLQEAQDHYKASADESRKEQPLLQVDNKVWLLRHNLKTNRPCNKLDYRRIRPYPIQK